MSKYYNKPVIGIDVASEFSKAAILSPNGDIYRNSFKFNHDLAGFTVLINAIKKVEEEFSMKPGIFMESTGVYHLTLFYFLKKNNCEVYVINPLVTNSNKNKDIRKVKNDNRDALSIAKLSKFEDIKAYSYFDISIFTLKTLCRDYYKFVDNRTIYKLKLSADLSLVFPGYTKIFSDTTGAASLAILKKYQTPQSILNAPKEEVIELLMKASKRKSWCYEVYDKLMKCAYEATIIAIPSPMFSVKILNSIALIENMNIQINTLLNEIKAFIESEDVPNSFNCNVKLIMSMGGLGFISAITLLSEIGDFDNFSKPKQLVAYLGIDPSVNESGKFRGDRNKMSKRGSRLARRVLYTSALSVIKKLPNGEVSNKILYDHYHKLIESKKKKVAIGAIMHKLVNYIFAILRDQKPYEQRLSKIHNQMFLNKSNSHVA